MTRQTTAPVSASTVELASNNSSRFEEVAKGEGAPALSPAARLATLRANCDKLLATGEPPIWAAGGIGVGAFKMAVLGLIMCEAADLDIARNCAIVIAKAYGRTLADVDPCHGEAA